MNKYIGREFWEGHGCEVARRLLGKVLVRQINSEIIKARVVETEAYHGVDDLASHASKGATKRTQVMFDKPGYIYVYMIYGQYHCLNIVSGVCGVPSAVLVRAVWPVEGLQLMIENRENKNYQKINLKNLANGPGKVCQALKVDKRLNYIYLGRKAGLWLEEDGYIVGEDKIISSKRVGVDYSKHCADWEWNYKLINI